MSTKCWVCEWVPTLIKHHIIRRADNGLENGKNEILLCVPCHKIVHTGFHNLNIDAFWSGIMEGDIKYYKIIFLQMMVLIGALKKSKKVHIKTFLKTIRSIPMKLELVKIRRIKRR